MGLMLLVTGLLFLWTRVVLRREVEREAMESFLAFGRAVELRFPGYAGESRRVLSLSERLGQAAGLSRDAQRRLAIAARLRDIGMCTIPYAMRNEKPEILWNEEERTIFQEHPMHGANMVEQLPSVAEAASAIRWHHQPFATPNTFADAPSGKSIPIEARILALVTDIALIERFGGDRGVDQQLVAERGRQYDPDLCDYLCAMLDSERGERLNRNS